MSDTADVSGPGLLATEPAALRDALTRVLASDPFARAASARALLQYLVDRRVLGDDTPVEEYVLGVDVLQRPVTYDPRADPIVRVQMRQLRLKLGAYYASAGQIDPVRLDIPKGEYRVVATRRPAEVAAAAHTAAADVTPASTRSAPGSRRWGWVLGTALGLALLATWAGWQRPGPMARRPLTGMHAPSVAVLPFDHSGDDPAAAAFSDGLADEVLVALARLEGLRVTGRSSSASVRGLASTEAGRRLGVDATISGSVRHVRDRFRVAVRLVRTSDDLVLWSDAYDGSSTEVLEIQERIAKAVIDALQLRLDPGAHQPFVVRGNADAGAHALYMEARRLIAARRSTAELQQSVSLLDQAIARDPGYAMAHAMLADVLSTLAYNGHLRAGEGVARARAAANRALALDPRLGEALAHLASLSAFVDWNWPEADRGFREALRLAPSHARIHTWHGQALLVQRRFDEALDALLTAQRLDPLAPSVIYAVGEGYLYWGRYEDALVQARRLLELDARSWGGHNLLARASFQLGRHDEVRRALARSSGELWADVTMQVIEGDQAAARALLEARQGELADSQPFLLASLYAMTGAPDTAVAWIERAYEQRQVDVVSLTIEPTLAGVRDDPRVRAVASKLRLADALARGRADSPVASRSR